MKYLVISEVTHQMTNTLHIHDLRTVLCRPNYTHDCNHILKHVIYYKFSILKLVTKSENQISHPTNFTKELHLIIKHQTF